MQMGFRWYGEGNDNIKRSDIKQIPSVTSIMLALHHKMPGEIWEEAEIAEGKRQCDEYNCLTLCPGSLNANPDNNVANIIRKYCDRIAVAHIPNMKRFENGDFSEASHRDCDDDTSILEIMRAYHDCGFKGYVRPGYGLYDHALGIVYMLGCWDMLERLEGKAWT